MSRSGIALYETAWRHFGIAVCDTVGVVACNCREALVVGLALFGIMRLHYVMASMILVWIGTMG